jgi:DNA polymerase epsilon subunit 1
MHLYELSMTERAFQRHDKALAGFLHHPDVEGVYETQTPLILHALMQLGCVTRIARHWKLQNPTIDLRQALPLEGLEFLTTTTHPYLDPASAVFKRCYLYHSHSPDHKRAVVGLFFARQDNQELEQLSPSDDEQVCSSMIICDPKC